MALYQLKNPEIVEAVPLFTPATIPTASGPLNGAKGDYVVIADGVVTIVAAGLFEAKYVPFVNTRVG